jgi:hypothetical protein
MSTLTDRICWLHRPQAQTIPDAGGPSYKDYGAVKAIPLTRVAIHPGVLSYDEPLIASDGAPITATGSGTWGQLYAVGKF